MVKRILLAIIALSWAVVAAAQDGYQIKPGDQLTIEVLEDPSLNRQVLVLPDGSISFPLVGSIEAGGRSTNGLRDALSSALSPNFASAPSVFVSVAALSAPTGGATGGRRTIDVYLMGEVASPGKAEVDRGTTLLQMLALSGGFSKFAAKKRVQLRRTDPRSGEAKVYTINYKDIEAGRSMAGQTVLADGDVIIVPQRKLFE